MLLHRGRNHLDLQRSEMIRRLVTTVASLLLLAALSDSFAVPAHQEGLLLKIKFEVPPREVEQALQHVHVSSVTDLQMSMKTIILSLTAKEVHEVFPVLGRPSCSATYIHSG